MPPNLAAVFFSFFISGVPVKAIKQALGNTCCIFTPNLPYWVRWASSISTNISEEVSALFSWLTTVSNLCMVVVITLSLCSFSSSVSLVPVVAFSTGRLHFLKVLLICSSRSVRSVTNSIFGCLMLLSAAKSCASITIVSDFPLPWVCHITPPKRLPSSMCFTFAKVSSTAKNCW